ncbi:putative ubiquitin-protein ligase [Cryptosporidium felis]|nr:putative ubiquitin-protein ligase [Cryptosporidium felis]
MGLKRLPLVGILAALAALVGRCPFLPSPLPTGVPGAEGSSGVRRGEEEAPPGPGPEPERERGRGRLAKLRSEGRYEELRSALSACGFADPRCAQMLGELYFTGTSVEQNIPRAVSLWKVAADLGDAEAQFSMGLAYTLYPLLPALDCEAGGGAPAEGLAEELDSVPCELYPYSARDAPRFAAKYESLIAESSVRSEGPGAAADGAALFESVARSLRLSNAYFYFSSLSGHAGSQLALAFRYEHGLGLPRSCEAAMANYLEVARTSASVRGQGFPDREQLVRLSIPEWEPMKKLFSRSENRNREDLAVNLAESGNITIQLALAKRYLLGADGFPQNSEKAYKYLRRIADRAESLVGVVLDAASVLIFGEAIGLLGYMHALGLGTPKDLKTASEYFSISAFIYNDPGGHNGMGYVYFQGCEGFERNFRLAFHHFNESAFHLFADAQYNLGSLYLAGMGTSQSYSEAISWFTRAYEQGHVPSAYALSQLAFNGLGTNRDCSAALGFLRSVLHTSRWLGGLVSLNNRLSSDSKAGRPGTSQLVLNSMKLAVTGHDPSLANLAALLERDFRSGFSDWGSALLGPALEDLSLDPPRPRDWLRSLSLKVIPRFITGLFPDLRDPGAGRADGPGRGNRWYLPQMLLEFSIYNDNVDSVVRYGDFYYYSRGAELKLELVPLRGDLSPSWLRPLRPKIVSVSSPNYPASSDVYRIAAHSLLKSRWMISPISEACFNLGVMFQFGIGVPQDLNLASHYYKRMLRTGNINKVGNGIGELLSLFARVHQKLVAPARPARDGPPRGDPQADAQLALVLRLGRLLLFLLALRLLLSLHARRMRVQAG